MTNTTSDTSADWDQAAFEKCDRRAATREQAAAAEKHHDLVHLTAEPSRQQVVHELVRRHSRHTDTVHAHGDALILSCAPGDAVGLRARLEPLLGEHGPGVEVRHGTFAAGSDLTQNVASLKERVSG